MAKMDQTEISERLAQLLEEFSAGGVHCVILAAAASDASTSVAFGLETNASDRIVKGLLRAGILKMQEATEANEPPLQYLM